MKPWNGLRYTAEESILSNPSVRGKCKLGYYEFEELKEEIILVGSQSNQCLKLEGKLCIS